MIQSLSIRLEEMSDTIQQFVHWLRLHGYTEWIHRVRPGKDDPPLPDATRTKLRNYYRDDVSRLRSYLERDLSEWPS